MKRPLRFLDELLCTPSQDHGTSSCLRTASEQIVPEEENQSLWHNTTMAESGAIICCIQYSNNILQIISSHYFWHQKKLTSLHRFEFPQTFHRNPAHCWPGSDRWSEWSPHTPSLSSSGPRPAPDQHRTCLWIIWWKLSWIKA